MKKAIFTLATIASLAFATINAKAATTQTCLPVSGSINKIEVHGNVEVMLTTGSKNEVTVNNAYYSENALIQDENGVLRITSYKSEKLMVYVTAPELSAIAAYDNASVKSDGKLSVISLDVDLYDSAYAGLNLDNFAADINVNGQAKADISGSSVEYSLNYNYASTVNQSELVAMNITETKTLPVPIKHHRFEKAPIVLASI